MFFERSPSLASTRKQRGRILLLKFLQRKMKIGWLKFRYDAPKGVLYLFGAEYGMNNFVSFK